jgi:hypothetical protein
MSTTRNGLPAQERPINRDVSRRVTFISLMVKWNVCVSGLQWSRSAPRREKSYRNRVMRSFREIASRCLSRSTNRAIGRSPAARSLKQIRLFISYNKRINEGTNNNIASVHVLGNTKVVDRQQRAHSAGTHVSNILSEDGRQERAVPIVELPIQQLRRHLRLNLSTSSLSLSLALSLVLNLIHTCNCIQKLNIQLKNQISNLYIL